MNHNFFATLFVATSLLAACSSNQKESQSEKNAAPHLDSIKKERKLPEKISDAAIILAKKQIPVLCYHHIREIKPGDSENMKSYSVTPAAFSEQMKVLSDSGYKTILPDELYDYLAYGKSIPEKSVMITFDDTDLEQYTLGAAEMKKYGFKGVYFIMTISIGRPRYMSKEQIKELSDDGHQIACHTWDHHMVTKYQQADWDKQLGETKVKMEAMTGKKIDYFAYPFGIWNPQSIPDIKSRGYKMAFILSTKRDSIDPLYTVRRMIVPGQWSTKGMMNAMRTTFSQR